MSCLRSFTFLSGANETLVAPDVKFWGLAPQNYWAAQLSAGTSTFNIQGFKNVNVHSIEAVGTVYSGLALADTALVQDWAIYLQINGQNPLISGNITAVPNRYSIVTQANAVNIGLTKYNPKFQFADPIQSVTSIQVYQMNAQGIGAQNLAQLNLSWGMNFIVYYTYEGE